MAKVNAPIGDNKHRVTQISYALFDFTGDVFVRVPDGRFRAHLHR